MKNHIFGITGDDHTNKVINQKRTYFSTFKTLPKRPRRLIDFMKFVTQSALSLSGLPHLLYALSH